MLIWHSNSIKQLFYFLRNQQFSFGPTLSIVRCLDCGLAAREPTWCCVLASLPLTTNYSVPIFQINRKCSKLKIFCSVIWWLNTEGAQISQIFIAFNRWTMVNHQLKSPNTLKCQISSNSLRSRAANISRLVLSVVSCSAGLGDLSRVVCFTETLSVFCHHFILFCQL